MLKLHLTNVTLLKYVTLLRMIIHTEEKPYGKSIHTEEEPYIYDFIIVSFIKNPVYKNNLLSNLLVKIYYFVHRGLLAAKLFKIDNSMLKSSLFILFCQIMLIIIKEQHYTLAGCVF